MLPVSRNSRAPSLASGCLPSRHNTKTSRAAQNVFTSVRYARREVPSAPCQVRTRNPTQQLKLAISKPSISIQECFSLFLRLDPQVQYRCYELLFRDRIIHEGIDQFIHNPRLLLPMIHEFGRAGKPLKDLLEHDPIDLQTAFNTFLRLHPDQQLRCYEFLCKDLVIREGIDAFLENPSVLLRRVNVYGITRPIIDHLSIAPSDQRAERLSISLNFQYHSGRHTLRSPVVGTRKEELQAIKDMMRREPIFRDLEPAIYQAEYIYLIPAHLKDEADAISRRLFLEYIAKYTPFGCTEGNIVDWSTTGSPGGGSDKTWIYDIENENNTWCVHAAVERRNGTANEKYGCYLPPHIVAYHELMHIEETPLGARRRFQDEHGSEILTALKTIILIDFVYKQIHHLDENTVVNYGKFIRLQGKRFKLGAFANFYRNLERRYGNLSQALLSRESIAYLKQIPSH